MAFNALFLAAGLLLTPQSSSELPEGAIVYLRSKNAYETLHEQASILRAAGLASLAEGISEAGNFDHTDPAELGLSNSSFLGGSFGDRLPKSLENYFLGFSDWGRGNQTQDTRKALQAIREVEFAIYPGAKAIQILQGELSVWLEVIRSRPTWKTTEKWGSFSIEQSNDGQGICYFSVSGSRLYRSWDLDLLRNTLDRTRTPRSASTLSESNLFRELNKREIKETGGFWDIPLLRKELSQLDVMPAPLLAALAALFQDCEGVLFFMDNDEEYGKAQWIFLTGEKNILKAVLGTQNVSADFLDSFSQIPGLGVATHLDIPQLMQRIFPKFEGQFDWKQSYLGIDSKDQPVLFVFLREPDSVQSLLTMLPMMGGMIPKLGIQASEDSGSSMSSFSYADEPLFSASVQGKYLVIAPGRVLQDLTASKTQSIADTLKPELFSLSKWIQREDFLLTHIGFLPFPFTGDICVNAFIEKTLSPPDVLFRAQLGIDAAKWVAIEKFWSELKTAKPKLSEAIENFLFQKFTPAQVQAGVACRSGITEPMLLANFGDRIEFDYELGFLSYLRGNERKEKQKSLEQYWQKRLQASKENTIAERKPTPTSFALRMNLTPLYDELIRDPEFYAGFLHSMTQNGHWPWFSLGTAMELNSSAHALGFQVEIRSSMRVLAMQYLSCFLDHYRISPTELGVVQKLMALESIQRISREWKLIDQNTNGVGEFAPLSVLAENWKKRGASSEAQFPWPDADLRRGEIIENGYRYRFLLSENVSERERRWCVFAIPEVVDFDRRLAFYMDERGMLLAGLQPNSTEEWIAKLPKELEFSDIQDKLLKLIPEGSPITRLASEIEPPDHRRVYEYFLPYLPAYGGRLLPGPQ